MSSNAESKESVKTEYEKEEEWKERLEKKVDKLNKKTDEMNKKLDVLVIPSRK